MEIAARQVVYEIIMRCGIAQVETNNFTPVRSYSTDHLAYSISVQLFDLLRSGSQEPLRSILGQLLTRYLYFLVSNYRGCPFQHIGYLPKFRT